MLLLACKYVHIYARIYTSGIQALDPNHQNQSCRGDPQGKFDM
jgi:hypothetical protein